MKKAIFLMVFLFIVGCTEMAQTTRIQNNFFDENGNKAGYSNELACRRQAAKEGGFSYLERQTCYSKPVCKELAEACLRGKGFNEAISFETTEERMAIYRKAYEESWIKPGMTRLEVVSLIGAPQITTFQLIPPRKVWIYCRSAAKTAFVGFNFVFKIIWNEDKVESVDRHFKI